MLSTPILGTAIMLAPLGIGLAIDRDRDDILAWTIMGSLPILIGTIAQRTNGRNGVAWWFLTFVVMVFFYRISRVSASPPAENPLYVALVGALLFGALPMLIIVATRRWRSLWLIAGLITVLTGLMLFTYITERIADRYIISYDVLLLGIILASLTVYLLPSIVADVRHHPQSLAIFVLNILLGWTLLGWIAALFWAYTNDVEHHMAPSVVPAANGWVENYDVFETRPFLEGRPDQHRAMA
jgi:uncharacterized membrane protein